MNSPIKVPAKLQGAQTLEEMLEAVPQLGECDTLATVPLLADYDRRAKGWFAAASSWIYVVLCTVGIMALAVWGLFMAGQQLSFVLRPQLDEIMDGLGGLPLQLLVVLVILTLSVLLFNLTGLRQWLIGSTSVFGQQILLRVLLLRAIRAQLNRNRVKVDGDWRRAVCTTCLARYERFRVRFAYWRWLFFARCRKCHNDQVCYTHVQRIEGWLDHGMEASQEQVGDKVRVNLLHRLPPQSLSLPIDLDGLVIADAEDVDVEMLIFLYRSEQPRTTLPKPKRLRFRLTEDSTVSQMSWRQLKQNFWFVSSALPRRK